MASRDKDVCYLPAGTVTCTVFVDFTFPTPPQLEHCPLRGIELPTPAQVGQVLAIWNPLSMTNVRVPEPPQVAHGVLLAPCFSPLPEQGLQSVTGCMLTDFVVPLHASMKETLTVAWIFAPFAFSEPRDCRPLKDPNN